MNVKLIKTVREHFKSGNRYSRKEVKEFLGTLYKREGIKRAGVYSDLQKHFGIKFAEFKSNGIRYIDIL